MKNEMRMEQHIRSPMQTDQMFKNKRETKSHYLLFGPCDHNHITVVETNQETLLKYILNKT